VDAVSAPRKRHITSQIAVPTGVDRSSLVRLSARRPILQFTNSVMLVRIQLAFDEQVCT